MLLFETDSHFYIGQRHLRGGKPCQDYALSGLLKDDAAYAIIADGCSSGRHTDVGARLVALTTSRAIESYWNMTKKSSGIKVPNEISFYQEIGIEGVKTALGLIQKDLLATCVYAFISPEGGFIHLQGDGVFAVKMKSGNIIMTRFDWANNAPAYPAYSTDNYESYIKAQGNDISALLLKLKTIDTNDESSLFEDEISLGEGIRGFTKTFSSAELSDIDSIAVFSDGVTDIENLEWQEAVKSLMTVKGPGEFITRRFNVLLREASQLGKGPLDDIAAAIIRISKPKIEESHVNQNHEES